MKKTHEKRPLRIAGRHYPTLFLETKPWVCIILAVLLRTPSVAEEGASRVTIEGGADKTLQNYSWTVTNHYSSPIVRVEFPHYRASLFFAPRGWTTKSTFLVNIGVPDKPGVCTATADNPEHGIHPGTSQEFGMQMSLKRAFLGEGTVKIVFADGTETLVTGVELPEPPEPTSKFVPLIGAGLIFGAWVLVRTLRERRRRAAATTSPAGEADE